MMINSDDDQQRCALEPAKITPCEVLTTRTRVQIFIEHLTGKPVALEVQLLDTVESVKEKIQEMKGIPLDQQRLVLPDGSSACTLIDGRTLSSYQIREGCTLLLVAQARSSISTFTAPERPDISNQFLKAPSTAAFQERWSRDTFDQYIFLCDKRDLLSASQRSLCMRFMDTLWRLKADWLVQQNEGRPVCDMSVRFTDKDAIATILKYRTSRDDAHNSSVLEQLLGYKKYTSPQFKGCVVAMRCTRGPTEGAIGWHFDEDCAQQTLELALNDDTEYEGRSIFARFLKVKAFTFTSSPFPAVCALYRRPAVLFYTRERSRDIAASGGRHHYPPAFCSSRRD
jgi:ubiquitin